MTKTRIALISLASVVGAIALVVIDFIVRAGADNPRLFNKRVADVERRFSSERAHGKVLLTGSSFFEKWTTSGADLAPLDTMNVGIGGTKIGDQVAFVDRLVTPFHPRAVVVYAGSNDISGLPFFSKAGADVAARVQRYLENLHRQLPDAPIFYVAITEAPIRAKVRGEIKIANALLADFAASTDYVTFIDTAPALLTADGGIDGTLFGRDRLHFNEAGYEKFSAAIRPALHRGLIE